MELEVWVNIFGWIGSVEIVVAYGLNSYQRLKSDSLLFYTLNITGGIFLIIYSVYKAAYANTFINVVWVLIAIPAVVNLMRKKKS